MRVGVLGSGLMGDKLGTIFARAGHVSCSATRGASRNSKRLARDAQGNGRAGPGGLMSNKKVWFITGASRGMGVDFAKAALAAGHAVVASGRDSDRLSKALGQP